jgi:hypothetical protein
LGSKSRKSEPGANGIGMRATRTRRGKTHA